MSSTGVDVKALKTCPELFEIEIFYRDMHLQCGSNFDSILKYCRLYGLTNSEILEAIQVQNMVANKVE
ncbi:MAG: hypothetical protein DRJ03_02625 [Chloroflexi bacterium]|nr:MAG: hypothetical protein DRJ03_02625 [Chloroflexota bacterium]